MDNNEVDDAYATASLWTWLGLIALSATSFWVQAVITEERFVPALNVIATHFRIPDDVAGATMMAAGASSPELFASVVALFVTHSSLGIGTIVGSEIFNQLLICAGSVYSARNQRLQLDKSVVLREVLFYGLALALLWVALSNRQSKNDGTDDVYIFLGVAKSLMLLGGFVLYVLVCANFERIVGFLDVYLGTTTQTDGSYLSNLPSIPFLRQVSREPPSNFRGQEKTVVVSEGETSSPAPPPEDPAGKNSPARRRGPFKFLVQGRLPKPSLMHGLEDIVEDADSMSCFLWQQSSFYSKTRVAVNAWQLRWFTFRGSRIVSSPDRSFQARQVTFPPFGRIEVDEAHLLIKVHSVGERRRDAILMAPNSTIFQRVLERFHRAESAPQRQEGDFEQQILETDSLRDDRGPTMINFPYGASPIRQFFHVVLFPMKLLIHVTVYDTRRAMEVEEAKLRLALVSVVACVAWIVVMSFAMVTSLEHLGKLLRIPDSVIGITISAAGTSLPNFVASQVAARQGLGNMAVSNAFGSNIFNIFIGLGLPWTVYTLAFGEYNELKDDEITTSVLILVAVLLIFVVMVFFSNFVLYRWHAVSFVLMYVAYLVYAIGDVYV